MANNVATSEVHRNGDLSLGKEIYDSGEEVSGYVLTCNNDPIEDDVKKNAISLSSENSLSLAQLLPGIPLFLYSSSVRKLFGVFETMKGAAANGALSIQDKNGKVNIKVRENRRPISEHLLRKVLEHYDGENSGFQLTASEVEKLLDLFDYVEKRAENSSNSNKADVEDHGGEWEHVKTKVKGGRGSFGVHHKSSSNRRASSPGKWRAGNGGGANGSSGHAYSSFSQDRDSRRHKASQDRLKPDRTDAPRWRSDPDSWNPPSSSTKQSNKGEEKNRAEDHETEQKRNFKNERKEGGRKHQRSSSIPSSISEKSNKQGNQEFNKDVSNDSVDKSIETELGQPMGNGVAKTTETDENLASKPVLSQSYQARKESLAENGPRPVSFAAALRGIAAAAEREKEKEKAEANSKVVEKTSKVEEPPVSNKQHKSGKGKGHRGEKSHGASKDVSGEPGASSGASQEKISGKNAWKKANQNKDKVEKGEKIAEVASVSEASGTSSSAPPPAKAEANLSTAEVDSFENKKPKVLEPPAPSKPAWKGNVPAVIKGINTTDKPQITRSQSAGEAGPSRRHNNRDHSHRNPPVHHVSTTTEDLPAQKAAIPTSKSDSFPPSKATSESRGPVSTGNGPVLEERTSEAKVESRKEGGAHEQSHIPPPSVRVPHSRSFASRASSFGRNSNGERNSGRKVVPQIVPLNGMQQQQVQVPLQVPLQVQAQGQASTAPATPITPFRIGTPPLVHVYHHQHYPYSQSQPQSPQNRLYETESQMYRPFVRSFMEPTPVVFPGGDGLFSPIINPKPVLSPLLGFPQFPLPHPNQTVNASILHDEVLEYSELVRPSKIARSRAEAAVDCVRTVVKSLWPGAEVEVFGSFATGLALPNSDVDVAIVNTPPPPDSPETLSLPGARINAPLIRHLAPLLQKQEWCESIYTIETARIPVIKLKCQPVVQGLAEETARLAALGKGKKAGAPKGDTAPLLPVAMDITIAGRHQNVLEGLENVSAEWIGKLAEANMAHNGEAARDYVKDKLLSLPALAPLVLLLKSWLQHRGLNDVYTGGLGSFALTLMVAFFLERAPISIGVPSMYSEAQSTSSESSGLSSPREGTPLPSASAQRAAVENLALKKQTQPLHQNRNGFHHHQLTPPLPQPSPSPSGELPSSAPHTSELSSVPEPPTSAPVDTEVSVASGGLPVAQIPPSPSDSASAPSPSSAGASEPLKVQPAPETTQAEQRGPQEQDSNCNSAQNNTNFAQFQHTNEINATEDNTVVGKPETVLVPQTVEYAYPVLGVPYYDPYNVPYEMDPRSRMLPQIMPPLVSYGDSRLVLRLPEYRRRRKGNSVVERLPSSIKSVPSPNYGVLLIGFLQAFGCEFDFTKVRLILKNEYGLPDGVFLNEPTQRPTVLWIDDPLRPGANIGAGSFAMDHVQASFRDLLVSLRSPDPIAFAEARAGNTTYLLDKAFNSPMSPPEFSGRASSV